MHATRNYAALMSLTEIERAMVRSSGLATVCRMTNADALAELHLVWVDILLDEWAARTGHPARADH